MDYTGQKDDALVALTLAGDQNAYEALVIRWQRAVIASANAITRSTYMAEDAAQDAFVSAWLKLDTLHEGAKYGAWVCRIAKNKAKDMMMRFGEFMDIDSLLYREYNRGECVDAALLYDGGGSDVRECVSALSEKVKRVVELYYYGGYSIAEIAKMTSVTVGTVKRQLYDGRKKIRKDLCAMSENEFDSLVQRVMKKVRELELWRLRKNKDGFKAAYEDVLADIDTMPESNEKSYATAQVYMLGWWWLPDSQSDERLAQMKAAAIAGRNEDVLCEVMAVEHNKLSAAAKIELMRDTQIPFFEENSFNKALGYVLFWLGREHFAVGEPASGFAAFERVLTVLEPSDVYYANAKSAIYMEKLICDKYNNFSKERYDCNAIGEEYRTIDSELRFWSQPGYNEGWLNSDESGMNYIYYQASRCDNFMYKSNFKPGDVYTGSDDSTLTFAEDGITVETPSGIYDGCELWVVRLKDETIRTFFKRGVGIVRQEKLSGGSKTVRVLKSCHIEGGEGLFPRCTGNSWVYVKEKKNEFLSAEVCYKTTYADNERVILSCYMDVARLSYDEDDWEEMIFAIRNDYLKEDSEGVYHVQDMSHYIERARALADMPLKVVHTSAACEVVECIMTTDEEFNPSRTESGHWVFFRYNNVTIENGIISIISEPRYCFEAKDMYGVGDAGYPMFYNHMLSILKDAAGCVWSDKWSAGYRETLNINALSNQLVTDIYCDEYGTVTTAAGTFENCLRVSLDVKGYKDGWAYRGGKMAYYFAPGVGIVRATHNYKDDTMTSIYELTEYSGTGDGYMPVFEGLYRRYDAVGLTEGYKGSIELTCAADPAGKLVLFESLIGVKTL